MSGEDAENIKQYQDDPDYAFSIGCTLLKYFPSLMMNTPGYSSVGAFEAEYNLITQTVAKLDKKEDH